jgi:hypothetical protein
MDFQVPHQRWIWNYCKEAADIGLEVAWNDVPLDHIPVILGAFFFKNDHEGFFNFNSFQRATKGISFFAERLPRSVLEVTDMEVYNKLFDGPVDHATVHAEIFDRNPSPKSNNVAWEERVALIESSGLQNEEKYKRLIEDSERHAKKPLALIERFQTNFYTDGIEVLKTGLRFREMIATKHWLGNKDFSFWDLVQDVLKQNPKIVDSMHPS